MRIERIINNNVVSARDEDGREVVLMGKGLGFKAKDNQKVDMELIEKIFKMDSKNSFDRFKELLVAMPLEHIQVSDEIIEYAKSVLGMELNQNIYITLTDHINFSVERHKQKMDFSNPLLWEVKKFYPREYMIGEYSIALIERRLNVLLTEDEAASIALHIVNAEYNTAMSQAMSITALMKTMIDMISTFIGEDLYEDSFHYARFLTHLKFLSHRIITKEYLEEENSEFLQMITTMCPEEYLWSKRLANYVEEMYCYHITTEELIYLTMHLKRIRRSTK